MTRSSKSKFIRNTPLVIICILGLIIGGIFLSKNAEAAQLTWEKVNNPGFGDAQNDQITSLYEFNSFLYAGTLNSSQGSEVWRSGSPASDNWDMVNNNGFDSSNNTDALSMIEFDSDLYVGTHNAVTGAEVWYCTSASGCDGSGDWTQANGDGFGEGTDIDGVYDLEVFGDYLYAATDSPGGGGEVPGSGGRIYRTNASGAAPPFTWDKVNTNGFGDSANIVIHSLEVFDSYLYASTEHSSGGEIWRSSDGTAWSEVVGSGAPFGPGNGFGDSGNTQILVMLSFEGNLYAGTYNGAGAELWRSADGASWAQVSTNGFGDTNNDYILCLGANAGYIYAGTRKGVTTGPDAGGELWGSGNGTNWEQKNTDGFGDTGNNRIVSLESYSNYLYGGTWHGSGEVWGSQSDEQGAVPEFTLLTIGLAFVLGGGIYFWIRKRKQKTT